MRAWEVNVQRREVEWYPFFVGRVPCTSAKEEMWHSHERSKTATFWEYLQQINDSNDVQIVKKSEGGNHMPWLAEEFGMFGSNMRCFVGKHNCWSILEVWILLTVLSRKTSAYFGMVSNGSGMVRRWPCPKCCYFKQPQLASTKGRCSYDKFIPTGSGRCLTVTVTSKKITDICQGLRLLSLTFSLKYPGTSQVMVVVHLQGSTWRRKHRRLDRSDCECWFLSELIQQHQSLCQCCPDLVLYRHVLTCVLKAQIQESLLLYKSYCNEFGCPYNSRSILTCMLLTASSVRRIFGPQTKKYAKHMQKICKKHYLIFHKFCPRQRFF